MKAVRLTALTLTLVVSLSVVHVRAQGGAVALPAGAQRITSVEGITEYQLANGLRVLLFPDQSKSTITVNITYLVGSRHESYGETGMAHLLEHMVFKGSTKHTNIPKELQDHGSRPNGTTSYDRTNYFETFAANDVNLEWALDLESDRMVNSFIAKKDLDSEMTVVRNEFESGENSPLNVLRQRVLSTAYLWHNYGKSTIGSRSDIENVPIERLQAFYRNYYQPDNTVLVVAGKIDEAKTLGLLAKYFGPVPRPQRTLPTIYTSEPTQDGERAVTLQRVGDVQNIVIGYHVPPGSHPDFPALQMASLILGENSPSGRIYKATVETKKASNVAAQGLQLREAGMFVVLAEVRKESSLDDAKNTLLATIDGVKTTPFTNEEVERARNRLLTGIDLQFNNSEQMALSLSNWASMGDWRLFFLNRDRIKSATTADVQRVATYYLKPANRTVGVFIPSAAPPDRAEIPAAPDLVATFKDYKGNAAVSAGEAFDASPANIEGRLRRMALPGGMKVMLLPKQTRGDTVSAMMRLSFGDEKSLAGQNAVAQLTGQLLMRGTTKHTRQQIQDELDRLKARMNVGGGSGGAVVNIETIAANLPAVLELAAEVLRQPAFPAAELETLRQQALSGLESQKAEPQAIVSRAFQAHLNPYPKGDVRYVPTLDEQIAELRAVTLDQVKQYYAGFYGASNAELAVVGDFDPEAILKVASTLNTWKSPKPYAQIKNPYRKIEAKSEVFETPDKANAFFLAGGRINIGDDHPDYPALMFANYLLGQGINSRLFARIRGKEGLSYGISSSLGVTPGEDSATFVTNAISAPENASKVEASFRDELAMLLKDGFTDAEIANGKASWLQGQQLNRDQNGGLANLLVGRAHYGRTMAWDAELEKKVQSLTSQQITAAIRRFWDVSSMTFMKGGDFKKATK